MTRADSENERLFELAEQQAEAWEQEEEVLQRAALVKEARDQGPLPACPEPKRVKAHWDNLLDEMKSLADIFIK